MVDVTAPDCMYVCDGEIQRIYDNIFLGHAHYLEIMSTSCDLQRGDCVSGITRTLWWITETWRTVTPRQSVPGLFR